MEQGNVVEPPNKFELPLPDSKEKMTETLAELKLKLPEKFQTPEFDDFIEAFAIAYETNRKLFKNGGKIEVDGKEATIAACDLDEHNWHHIHCDLKTAAHILPGLLKTHPQYELNDIKNLFLATLLHDDGWLINSLNVDENGKQIYAWGAEKFFIHCQDSIALAAPILQLINKNIESQGKKTFNLSPKDMHAIREGIRITEFNKLAGETMPQEGLAEVLFMADRLSYFADQKHIPAHVQGLFREAQASASPKCKRTFEYFYENLEKIAGNLGMESSTVEELFLRGRLTIADIKFPDTSRHAGLYVGSGYLPFMLPELTPALDYIDQWYGNGINEDRYAYYINIARSQAIKELNQESHTDGLCYFEGSFEISDILSVGDKYNLNSQLESQLKIQHIDLKDLELKTLGIGKYKHDIFARLSTRVLRTLLDIAQPEDRVSVLTDLFQKVAEKGNPSDSLRVAIAPFAYRQPLDYEEIITPSDISETVERCNRAPGEKSKLELIWTVRRERDFIMPNNQDKYFDVINRSGIRKVIFAGSEEDELVHYEEFLKKLVGAGIEVIIQAGQILDEDLHPGLAEKNITFALDFAATHEKVQLFLMGNHIPKDKVDQVGQLAAQNKIFMSPSTDIEAGIVADFESHPASKLASAGIYVGMASCNQQFPSTMVLEALGVACAQSPPEFTDIPLTDYERFVGKYKEYYLAETRKFLFSPN